MPCPTNTQNHTGPAQPYSCLAVYLDNANRGHHVLLRQGHGDPAGFGLLHAVNDHNIDEHSIATTIVNSAAGIFQPNLSTDPDSGGPAGGQRYLYGMTYEVGSLGLVSVEVREDRAPSTASTDNDSLGVLTAYCVGMTRCPDEVDESIEQSTGG